MVTEVAISFNTLRAQLESEKSNLFKIDENIKKIVQTSGRFTDRFNGTGDYARGGLRGAARNNYSDLSNHFKNDDPLKRKHETKTVFSRLSARVQDSDGEEEVPDKRARVHSTVCKELPTRAAVLRAQGDDEQARTRNRRIFGSLLGTLQKFKQEEIVLQTKEEKKAQVEKKIEEQAKLEKEREQKQRRTLFAEREHKKATIKALEAKMARVQEFEKWEASQQCLGNFIVTKAKPHVYWLPKKLDEKATEKLNSSRKFHEKTMSLKRQELQEELLRIEMKVLRPRGPGAKENYQQNNTQTKQEERQEEPEDRNKRRDKFAIDEDEVYDSDGDERQDDSRETNNITEETNMDTNTENATVECEEKDTKETEITQEVVHSEDHKEHS
ncbi:pinin isoform X2 [Danaus plexippus]|uniref:pinin isoform X2 n=1 Tax=Danaus plexippus TaxID=13037 RepID=UPI0013C4AE4D|nr:pinin isoform X2 [Danaus plexippus]